jgi:hypothetical protein
MPEREDRARVPFNEENAPLYQQVLLSTLQTDSPLSAKSDQHRLNSTGCD